MKNQGLLNTSALYRGLCSFAILLLLFAACKKDETEVVRVPLAVTDYYPNSGNQGTLVTVEGTGLSSNINAVSATFAGTKADVVSATSSAIVLRAPSGGATGDIVMKVNEESVTVGKYTYQDLTITKISPANGSAGTHIRISGAGFGSLTGPAEVYINGKLSAVVSASDTLIVAEVPVDAGSGPVMVKVNGKEASGQSFKFQSIAAVKPLTGGKGTKVRISGAGFEELAAGNTVEFNGKVAVVEEAAEDHLIVIAPDEVSTGALSVTINGQKVTGPVFTVVVPPAILNVTPLSGPSGTEMTITGTTFSTLTEENKVTINGVNVPVKTATAFKLTLDIPGGTGSGKILLRVNDQLAEGPEFKDQTLGIARLSPESGLAGTRVTITGTGFNAAAAQNAVTFNGTAATVESASATTLVVIAPEGFTSGPLKVVVNGVTAIAPVDFNRAGVITLAGGVGNTDLSLINYKTSSLVVDSKGNVFVIETEKYRIKKIATDGTVTLFAGSGVSGNADGQGSAASFSFAYNPGMSIDANDNLFVSDYKGIRKITPQGMVSTFTPALSTLLKSTFDENGILYVARGAFDGAYMVSKTGVATATQIGRSGYAEEARFVIAGNVAYTADYNQASVQAYTLGSNVVNYVASGFSTITAVVADGAGNLYVADKYGIISKVNIASKEKTTVVSFGSGSNVDGSLTEAKSGWIGDMTIDKQGNLYFIDMTNNAVRKIFLK
ncbi:IPT/TIG domain-containing protein [Pedobacter sp. AW31-3R]|uniref:IPT/TIG domain-containing protein n=1 Tax=Pedobacter sp. AW31-3R TaxID=3445781 RepID=UPI003FA03043